MKLQHAVYFIIAFIFVHGDEADFQIIKIRANTPIKENVVQLQKELIIDFEGAFVVRCSWNSKSPQNGPIITYGFNYNTGSTSVNIPSVTKDMSTQWICKTEGETHYIIVNVRVKCAYAVKMTVVGSTVSFQLTSLSVKEYDGIYNYECEVGDTIDITCSNMYETGNLALQYFDAQGVAITRGQSLEKDGLSLLISVRGENVNGSYVDCTYVRTSNDKILLTQEFKYRTMFIVTNRNSRRNKEERSDPNESRKPNVIVIVIFSVATLVSVFGIAVVYNTCVNKKMTGDTQNIALSN